MARHYKFWTKEEKLEVILPIINCKITVSKQHKITGASEESIVKWIRRYKELGIAGLENKRKPGNPLAKYVNKKSLTKEEQLEYEVMKLRIENERLKKGYYVKEDGTVVIYKK